MPCRHIRLGEFVPEGERVAADAVQEFLGRQTEDWWRFTNGVRAIAPSVEKWTRLW